MKNITSEKKALERLAEFDDWEDSYTLGITLGTLRKLHAKGSVRHRDGAGSIAFPTVGIDWKLEDKK